MLPKVYIDGQSGTTGLRIREWMARRDDVELLEVPYENRRDIEARQEQVFESDVSILCLPDDSAREVAAWAGDSDTRIIDASTAHRVADGWTYGLPELQADQRDTIREAKFVTNPGCYPTAFILLTRPLVEAGMVSDDLAVSINALSGYSGGGRSMIERWENPESGLESLPYEAPYALTQRHKHVPEMMKYTGLSVEPQFVPSVGPFRCGMRVQTPINAAQLRDDTTGDDVWEILRERYKDEPFVTVAPQESPLPVNDFSFDPQVCNDTNRIELHVVSHASGHVLLIGLLDNLGKGACGGAIQNMNLMLGMPEGTGLPQ
ncbi:MAG: N-acetyl-gamma-glutamyl-phosphate reductase [SAR202 cluster bacterium]|jgi:N-acetyl-gamma-glutamyl-phosphate reductase|nr:N-acetyl-gamma-glutamyl-phosphate reductase [Chloroflexota bacterium]MDP6421219.1 N-acetyl-gamma-glutamyl-phosphate reductase [SAR202 cluster bacterium]HAL47459.1 N-acetyl-gamma-glutamyl-phosphate reductase [Dehalococcoidia bacterium]MDP6665335.1 N-acetyl-gamma-glutamyl-phosphate reductase [SAR202 cluster bacterium]MDP6799612.1 N-acetyl-gamma-glutamyl-phosphate reductase [SAR202 cluster bacterium]|tara:strand:+ start:7827 stop:8783 length:957 start_codon:yes stop_codon:yes gene_type:complete